MSSVDRSLPEPGRRVSLRRVRDDGELGDLIGFVITADPECLRIQDRRGVEHRLDWARVLAWRAVGVARGRDPLRTPPAELAKLAVTAQVSGRVFVARLSDLLDHRPPIPVSRPGDPPPWPASVVGEWVTAGAAGDVIALAWWAAHRDARSCQLRTDNAGEAEHLTALGFTEVPT